ncbi:MAG: hypothetical protein D6714_00840 [Bacteroidetes bacterium]|nr:MAG: hypothetical protein D6714_00840 [Bacteroidota bacterium]
MISKWTLNNIRKRKPARFLTEGLILFTILTCGRTSPGVEVWEVPAAETFKFYPVKSGNVLILPSKCPSGDCILAVDVRSGKKLWSSRDTSFKHLYYNCTPLIRGTSFLLPVKNQLFCFNTSNGSIEWIDNRRETGENHIFGYGNRAFRTYRNMDSNSGDIIRFNIENGDSRLIEAISVRNISTSIVRSPVPCVHGKDTILLTGVTDYTPKEGANSYILLWSLVTPEIKTKYPVYNTDKQGRGPTHHPVVSGNLSFWNIDKDILCFDVVRKMVCWRITLPNSLLTSRMVVDETNLYAACEDGVLYAIELKTGKIKWKTKISTMPGRVFFVRNKIFLIGGGDRAIYEVARENGQVIRKLWLNERYGKLERVSGFFDSGAVISDGKKWRFFNPEKPDSILFHVQNFDDW